MILNNGAEFDKEFLVKLTSQVNRAFAAARKNRLLSYSPYSKFKVGAAVIASGGKITSGCNIENASYGGTICAERVAILKSVSEGGQGILDVVVVTDATPPATPCALCLQTMAEFCEPDARIWIANTKKIVAMHLFSELLTHPFGPKQLKQAKR